MSSRLRDHVLFRPVNDIAQRKDIACDRGRGFAASKLDIERGCDADRATGRQRRAAAKGGEQVCVGLGSECRDLRTIMCVSSC